MAYKIASELQWADLAKRLNAKADKTALPTVNDTTITINKNGAKVDTFTTNQAEPKAINIEVPTTADEVGALGSDTKYGASIDLELDEETFKITVTLKDQDGTTLGKAKTIDLPLESVVVNGSYDKATKTIKLELKNGTSVDIPVADLVAGLQTQITVENKLSADLIDDTSSTNKFVTQAEKDKIATIGDQVEEFSEEEWSALWDEV